MKTLFLEPFSGISGNMFLGTLLDLGMPFAALQTELAKLNLGEYELIYRPVNKCGIKATYFDVNLPAEHEHLPEGHEHLSAEHEHLPAGHEHLSTEHEHVHVPVKGQDDESLHEHLPEHVHGHHHGHRNYADIMSLIEPAALKPAVKERASRVLLKLAEAESRVHGLPVSEIHFHEVGAIDTIIDIVGSLIALDYLGIEQVYTTGVATGSGFVKCAHGLMPVPAPATAELLRTLPHYQGQMVKELTTPTGAALLAALAVPVKDVPAGLTIEKIGYGAGSWNLEQPNVLRANLGEVVLAKNSAKKIADEEEAQSSSLLVLEANIDDQSPEILAYTLEKLLQQGALDAWLTPVIMKKGRAAHTLSVLTRPELADQLEQVVFAETSTLGIRAYQVKRKALARKYLQVKTDWGLVTMKCAYMNGRMIHAAPEFEECKKLALAHNIPLQLIMDEVQKAMSGRLS
jgi:uncharacterized protein (TIGR00299 family) protein